MSDDKKKNVKRYIRAIHFDLDTHALQDKYPTKNWRKAYDDIGDFLKSKGFVHRQGSGYISKDKLSKYQVSDILDGMLKQLPYLIGSVNKLDVDNILKEKYDYSNIFEPTTGDAKTIAKEDAKEYRAEQTDKTVDDPQDWSYNADDDDLDLTGQSQSRGR